jgi:ubiquinone/menaquinone biosynthesis C-methylase UbiE
LTLEPSQARSYYDRFGKNQDTQSFYEEPVLSDLIAHAHLSEAQRVFEFGCGTGRFAAHLLAEHLPSSASYLGCDLSQTMIGLATERLANYAGRAQVLQSDETIHFPLADHSVDRVIATYVLDLLSDMDSNEFFREARRVLIAEGKLCLVSLTEGTTFLSRIVSCVWASIFRWHASWVGGCRPIRLQPQIRSGDWELEYHNVVVAFGVPSEVLVARPRHSTE